VLKSNKFLFKTEIQEIFLDLIVWVSLFWLFIRVLLHCLRVSLVIRFLWN